MALVLTMTLAAMPGVWIYDANTSGIELVAWGDYEYNVYISHHVTHCLWYPPHSVKVMTGTTFDRRAFRWSDYDISAPHAGDEACIWWDAQPEPSVIYFGIQKRNVIQRLYLPVVIKDV